MIFIKCRFTENSLAFYIFGIYCKVRTQDFFSEVFYLYRDQVAF